MKTTLHLLLLLCISCQVMAQDFKKQYNALIANPEAHQENEQIVYKATQHLFSHPPANNETYRYATKIVGFWMNQDTPYSIPTFGGFYNTLTIKGQKFFYTAAMLQFLLQEKLEHQRLIIHQKQEGIKFKDLETVKETQYAGAQIVLRYFDKYNMSISKKTARFLKALKKGTLKSYFTQHN